MREIDPTAAARWRLERGSWTGIAAVSHGRISNGGNSRTQARVIMASFAEERFANMGFAETGGPRFHHRHASFAHFQRIFAVFFARHPSQIR
jgi:hypothetical protein